MNPPSSKPWWAEYYKEITVEGIDPNDFAFLQEKELNKFCIIQFSCCIC